MLCCRYCINLLGPATLTLMLAMKQLTNLLHYKEAIALRMLFDFQALIVSRVGQFIFKHLYLYVSTVPYAGKPKNAWVYTILAKFSYILL